MNDNTSSPKEQIEMMIQRDGLIGEVERWELDRKKHWVRIFDVDKELAEVDPDRLQKVQQLQKQIALLSDHSHVLFEDGNKAIDELAADELPRKRDEYVQLMKDGDHHLWSKRLREFELVVHCNEEIDRCREEAERLDKLIVPQKAVEGLFDHWTKENIDRSFQEMVEDDPEFFEDFRTPEEVQIDELEIQNDALEERLHWAEMSAEREVRKKNEKLAAMQIQFLEEYIDQLKGFGHDPNEQWEKEVALLDKQNVVGETVTVYFTGVHQRKSLALRYKEDLQNRQSWEVKVKSKSGANKYTVERHGKSYVMALSVDEKSNHVVCRSFQSKTDAWFNAYKRLGGPSSINQMKAYDLYQWHDKVELYLQEKKGQRN